MPENFIPSQEESDLICFFSEDIEFQISNPIAIQEWINQIIKKETRQLVQLTFIFCSDSYLHQVNLKHLNHDTLTDVITFPYSSFPKIEGDIFISIDRIKDNSNSFNVTFEQELHRVMIHGVLHLCGYTDKTPDSQTIMRTKENEALDLLTI